MNYSGDATFTSPVLVPAHQSFVANAKFDFPQNIVLGYSFRPSPNWNFEFNLTGPTGSD